MCGEAKPRCGGARSVTIAMRGSKRHERLEKEQWAREPKAGTRGPTRPEQEPGGAVSLLPGGLAA